MPSSSLVFLVIIALWAVFLLQHWIRRREALATAHAMDRFSEGMRVLERNGPAPLVMDAEEEQTTRTSLRAGQVLVGERDEQPQVAEEPRARRGVQLGGRAWQTLSRLERRQVRGLALLGSLGLFLITFVSVGFGALPAWTPVASFVLLIGVVVLLRHTATKAMPSASKNAQGAARARRQPKEHAALRSEPAVQPRQAQVRDSFYDSEAVEASLAPQRRRERVEGGWDPIAVPRPTYAMKAQATVAAPLPDSTPVAELPFDGYAMDEELEELPAVYRVS